MSSPKQLIIGIDGATFDLIDPWIEDGKLPNLEYFLNGGVRSPLETTYPPLTAPAWASFMTGSNPGKTGVYDFLTSETESEDIVNYDSIQTPTLWEMLQRNDLRLGLVNVPVTYPPPEVNGEVIAGPLAGSNPEEAGRPRGLIEELEQETGHEWWPRFVDDVQPSNPLEYLEAHLRKNRSIGAFSEHLLKTNDYDCFMVLFDVVDSISHFFWHYMDESHPYYQESDERFRSAILEAYQLVDDFLGTVREEWPDRDVLLMSDHGFGPIQYMVNLNNFFMDQGLLELKNRPSTYFKKLLRSMGITPDRLVSFAETVGFDHLAFALPKSIRNKIIGTMGSYSDIDWSSTICYSRGHMGQVHIVDRLKDSKKQYKNVRSKVVQTLKNNLRDPETDKPLVSDVHFKEDMYDGPYLDEAPDIFLEMKDFECIAYPLFSGGKDLFIPHIQDGRFANHRMTGIFGARGPSFCEGKRLDSSNIYDLAPTIAYLCDIPLEETMDGEILKEALRDSRFDPDTVSYQQYQQSEFQTDNSSASEEARERLEGLGYLG